MMEETAFNSRPTSHWQRNYLDNFPERKTPSEVKWKLLSPVWLCETMDYTVHGVLQARTLEWVTLPFSRRSSQPRSPALQVDSLPAEPQGKPKNTGVGSLFLLQHIFPTQESNQGLLHCMWILYQLSYQGSPDIQPLYKQHQYKFICSLLLYHSTDQ